MNMENLSMVVCRDYNWHGNIYEYVIYQNDADGECIGIAARKGGFKGSSSAKRAGLKMAEELMAA